MQASWLGFTPAGSAAAGFNAYHPKPVYEQSITESMDLPMRDGVRLAGTMAVRCHLQGAAHHEASLRAASGRHCGIGSAGLRAD